MIYSLYVLALVLLPFTSTPGPQALGELQHVASAYVYFLAFALCLFPVLAHFRVGARSASVERIYGIHAFALLFFAVIGLSFATNVLTIRSSILFGRSGMDKFVASSILVVYGFMIAYLTYFLAARYTWDRLIMKPIAISVIICAVFSAFELAARYSGAMASLFSVISAPIYGDIPILQWDVRLRSVAFEPTDFANSACYMWPWMLGAVMSTKGLRRAIFLAVWLVLNGMIVLSEARTSLVMMTGLLVVFAVLWFVFLPKQGKGDPEKLILPLSLVFTIVIPCAIGFLVYFYDSLVANVVADSNVSNLSRLASMTAAFRMFADHPLFGLGFGQFGFHIVEYMPSWGYYSPEIKTWLFGAIGYWPAVYSIYARFGADMGILGIAMWAGIWLWLAYQLLIQTMRYRQRTGEIPYAAYPLILSCFDVLLAGIPSDSVRSAMIWINMGLACQYLASLRRQMKGVEASKTKQR